MGFGGFFFLLQPGLFEPAENPADESHRQTSCPFVVQDDNWSHMRRQQFGDTFLSIILCHVTTFWPRFAVKYALRDISSFQSS